MKNIFGKIYLASAVALMLASCSTPKNIPYFQNLAQGDEMAFNGAGRIRIAPDDKIVIIVNSRDPQLTALFNLPYVPQRLGNISDMGGNYSQGVCGYSVDSDGCIDFPVLGKLHIGGMTRSEVEDHIKSELINRNLVMDPVVTVDYMNLHVSVMGDVSRPGRYNIDHDSYTIMDALGAAGDLLITAKRENVKVLRQENGVSRTYVLDLTDAASVISSPAYFIRQNDVIYVEPNKMKSRQSTINGNNVLSTSFWISVASLATSVVSTIFIINR